MDDKKEPFVPQSGPYGTDSVSVDLHLDKKTLTQLLRHGAYEILCYYGDHYEAKYTGVYIRTTVTNEGTAYTWLEDENFHYVYLYGYPDRYHEDLSTPIFLDEDDAVAYAKKATAELQEKEAKKAIKIKEADDEIAKAQAALDAAKKKKQKTEAQ